MEAILVLWSQYDTWIMLLVLFATCALVSTGVMPFNIDLVVLASGIAITSHKINFLSAYFATLFGIFLGEFYKLNHCNTRGLEIHKQWIKTAIVPTVSTPLWRHSGQFFQSLLLFFLGLSKSLTLK